MENLSGISGYVASTLVLLTFVAKDMRLLRTTAIFSNLAFIIYGAIAWLPPVLILHLVLLPLNIVRLAELIGSPTVQSQGALAGTPASHHETEQCLQLSHGVTARRASTPATDDSSTPPIIPGFTPRMLACTEVAHAPLLHCEGCVRPKAEPRWLSDTLL